MEEQVNIVNIVSKEKMRLQSILNSLRKIETLQKDPLTNLDKIKHEVNRIDTLLQESQLAEVLKDELRRYVENIKTLIPTWQEELKITFGLKLEDELKKIGFQLRGHYPLLKAALYTIEVQFHNSKAIIYYGPQQERLIRCRLVPKEVVKNIQEIHANLTKRKMNSKKFLLFLYNSYKSLVRHKNKRLGDPIAISDILPAYMRFIRFKSLKKKGKMSKDIEYARALFSYDLYRLRERRINDKVLEIITATRQFTRKKSDFLWIPYNEEGDGNYVSHLKFREVKV